MGPKPKLDPVIIKELYDKGFNYYSYYEDEFKVSHKTVYRAFKKLGIQLEQRESTGKIKWNKDKIISFYLKSESISKTADMFDLNIKTLRSYLQEWGVFVNEQPRYDADYDFFENIDTEEKAYWLGFIAADGCLNNIRSLKIALAIVDIEHLNRFNHSLNSNYPIRVYERGPSNKWKLNAQPGCEVCLTSEKLSNDLIDKGITKRKTHTLQFPDERKLPKNLYRHFIRGVFDGDGCISFTPRRNHSKGGYYKHQDGSLKIDYRFSIVGNKEFIERIQEIMVEEIGLSKTKLIHSSHHTDNVVSVSYGGNNNVERIYDWLYDESTIYLDRKYSRFQELLEEKRK